MNVWSRSVALGRPSPRSRGFPASASVHDSPEERRTVVACPVPPEPRPRHSHLRRFILENQVYHVSTATKDRERIFAEVAVAELVLEAIQFLRKDRAFILSFAIMPDHLHLVLVPRPDNDLPRIMQSLKGYTARQINRRKQRRAPVWQQSYYDRMIRTERHLQDVIDYVEQNPVKAGLCDDPAEYPFSSAGKPELTDMFDYPGG